VQKEGDTAQIPPIAATPPAGRGSIELPAPATDANALTPRLGVPQPEPSPSSALSQQPAAAADAPMALNVSAKATRLAAPRNAAVPKLNVAASARPAISSGAVNGAAAPRTTRTSTRQAQKATPRSAAAANSFEQLEQEQPPGTPSAGVKRTKRPASATADQSDVKRRNTTPHAQGAHTPRGSRSAALLREGAAFVGVTPECLADGDVNQIELRNRTVAQSQGSMSARTRSARSEDGDEAEGGSAGVTSRRQARRSAKPLKPIPEDGM
jgi:hypothetical protein